VTAAHRRSGLAPAAIVIEITDPPDAAGPGRDRRAARRKTAASGGDDGLRHRYASLAAAARAAHRYRTIDTSFVIGCARPAASPRVAISSWPRQGAGSVVAEGGELS